MDEQKQPLQYQQPPKPGAPRQAWIYNIVTWSIMLPLLYPNWTRILIELVAPTLEKWMPHKAAVAIIPISILSAYTLAALYLAVRTRRSLRGYRSGEAGFLRISSTVAVIVTAAPLVGVLIVCLYMI